ncbi:MerR family transcriptional regulator, partial [Acinetobacter baumannii]|nr:MerR family transcriptional regulator [Acinetobacter baumannii]
FRSRFIHFEIIGLNKPYRLGLCNKAVLLPCFDLDERVFTLCPVVQEKLQTELKHVSDQLNKLQTSQSLLQSFLAKGKAESTNI